MPNSRMDFLSIRGSYWDHDDSFEEEDAVREYGEFLGEHHGKRFYCNEDCTSGAFGDLGDLTPCDVFRVDDKFFFKTYMLIPNKRKSPKKGRGYFKQVIKECYVIEL